MSVLRKACLSDLPVTLRMDTKTYDYNMPVTIMHPFRMLYDAEWRKRGFQRSP